MRERRPGALREGPPGAGADPNPGNALPDTEPPVKVSTTAYLILFLGAAIAFGCTAPGGEQLEAGRRALGRGQYNEAIAFYSEVALQAPGTPQAAQALYEIATIHYLKLRDLDAARNMFRKLLSDYPESPVARQGREMLARMYEEDLADPARAIQEYQVLLADTEDAREERSLLAAIANCRYLLNNLPEAVEGYERLIEDYPYQPEADGIYLRLAHIESMRGRDIEALEVLDALFELSRQPEMRLKAYVARGEILLEMHRYEEAAVTLTRAEEEFPAASEIAALRSRLLEQEREEQSLDDGAEDSRERLEEMQRKIPWGGARRRH